VSVPAAQPQQDARPLPEQFKAPRTALEQRAQELATIRTPQDLEAAGKVLVDGVRALERRITESYGRILAPQLAAVAATRAEQTEQLRPVLAAKATLDAAIKDYGRRQREARERLAARELAAADRRGEEAPPPPPPVAKMAGVSTREHYSFEVLDVAALKPEYLMVDMPKVRKIVNALGPAAVQAVTRTPGGASYGGDNLVRPSVAIRVWRDDVVASSRRGGGE
jgi:hypothetical protein